MKKILVFTPYPYDANSFWRCMGPLAHLAKFSKQAGKTIDDEISVTLIYPNVPFAWTEISQYDLVFLHRPCRNDDMVAMQISHNLNIPVWVDYDDWLFDLPTWNKAKKNYDNPGVQQLMAQCIACADVVSVSTPELHNLIKPVNKNVIVVPNAYRSDIFTYRKNELQDRHPIAYWRGTNTHDGDLLSVREGFQRLGHKVRFIGDPSWLLLSGMKEGTYDQVGSQDVFMFTKYLYDIKPKVMVFPLFDCLFNRCKSNIAYIEAMHAGALCVAPDLPEWQREGVITYEPHNSDSFVDSVHAAFSISEVDHKKLIQSAFESMKNSYDITVVNQIREHIVKEVTSPDFERNQMSPFDHSIGMQALAYFQGIKRRGGAIEQTKIQGSEITL